MGWQDAPVTSNPSVQAKPAAWATAPVLSDKDFANRVENQESRHNPNAVNPKSGAMGSMQTLPSTLRDPGFGVAPAKDNSPAEQTRVGQEYLTALRKKYGNDVHALAAYNWGPGHVDKLIAEGKGGNDFTSHLPAETQNYITKISGSQLAQPAPAAPAKQPAWVSAPVVQQQPAQPKTLVQPATQPPQNGKEWLASISEPATKAGANLISGAIAPFLSQKSLDVLQKQGLYTPRESPLHEFSTATYGTMMAPAAPVINAVSDKAKVASNATVGPKATNMMGDAIDTAMDIAGFVAPGVFKKGEPVTPATVEAKLTELDKKHDATTDPVKQEKIKKQMMDLVNSHPETENLARTQAAGKWQDAPKVQSAPAEAASGLRNVLSPESAGPKAEDIGTTIRAETGTANRQTSKAEAKLAQSYDKAATMTPGQQGDFYQYVEGRSTGAKLADPTLQKIADDTREVMENIKGEIEKLPDSDKINFIQDYFPRNFKNPEKARAFANQFIAKQGSSQNLKSRSSKYPTLADAAAAGIELVDKNPVRAASRYATSMNNYIASKRIATQIINKGDAKYYMPGRQPEGWVPLAGRFAERTRTFLKDVPGEDDQAAAAMHEKLFAPPDVARVYNNFYSRGVETTDLAKPYEIGRSLNAANTAAELSLSAYHLGTITGQLLANDVSRVMKNLAVGDWMGVGKAVKSATIGQIPFVKGSTYKLGKQVMKQYKGLEDHGIDMESIAEHFERGGGKLGQEKLYRGGEQGGFITGRGGIKQATRDIKDQWQEPGMSSKGKAALDVFQRVTEDISYPLFEKYIPSVKTGAFANLMGDWMRQNPGASDTAIQAARKKYVDLVDDRFGEMNMDNVFWHKYLKQASSLFLRAQGWDIGLVRQAGGGVLDTVEILKQAFKGKKPPEKLLDRPAFLASVIGTMALTSAAYQYMKTGKPPEEMLDYFAPKTGGTSTRGTAERTILPTAAHGREILHMAAPFGSEGTLGTESPFQGLSDEIESKMSSFPKNVIQAYQNQDYFGNKIGDNTTASGWMGSVPDRVGHIIEGFAPFGIAQSDKLQGSNLNWLERVPLGMRPAGKEIADPDIYKNSQWAKAIKEEKKSMRSKGFWDAEKAQ